MLYKHLTWDFKILYIYICIHTHIHTWGFLGGATGKEPSCQCRRHKRCCRFDAWVGKTPWNRKWQPTSGFLPGKLHRQRSLVGTVHGRLSETMCDRLQHVSNTMHPEPLSLEGFRNLLNLPFPDTMRKSMHLVIQAACESRVIQQESAMIRRNETPRTYSSLRIRDRLQIKSSYLLSGTHCSCVCRNKLQHFVKGSSCNGKRWSVTVVQSLPQV